MLSRQKKSAPRNKKENKNHKNKNYRSTIRSRHQHQQPHRPSPLHTNTRTFHHGSPLQEAFTMPSSRIALITTSPSHRSTLHTPIRNYFTTSPPITSNRLKHNHHLNTTHYLDNNTNLNNKNKNNDLKTLTLSHIPPNQQQRRNFFNSETLQSIIHELRPHKPKGRYIGSHDGHKFWEFIEKNATIDTYPRRFVEYQDDIPVPNKLHELWDLWLQNTIDKPPTEEDIKKYDERMVKYHQRIEIMKARDDKLRLEEQLQRKLSSELNYAGNSGQNGSTQSNQGGDKQDPMEAVKEFMGKMEQDLAAQRDMDAFSEGFSRELHQVFQEHGSNSRNSKGRGSGPRQGRGGMDFGFQMSSDGNNPSPPSSSSSSSQPPEPTSWDPSKPRKFTGDF